MKKCRILALLFLTVLTLTACNTNAEEAADEWLEKADLEGIYTEEELYQEALKEDVLIVYTVSTRAVATKDAFEKAYPGLCVEIRDLRSPDLVENVQENFREGRSSCDVVICNDNSGDFKTKLVDTGIVVPYLSASIKEKMKADHVGECISFMDEAELLFYSTKYYEKCPITNIWQLTDPEFAEQIYIPNPLRSFSTYALVAACFDHEEEIEKAYEDCYGTAIPRGEESAVKTLWRGISQNAIYTNSSDEVMEALNTGKAQLGIMVSSKMRYREMGYGFAPVYHLTPFCGCATTVSVMMARNSRNIHAAKLFIDFLLGGEDGQGEGYKPFITQGSWSGRVDVPDVMEITLEDMDLIRPDVDSIAKKKDAITDFWSTCLTQEGQE